MQIDKSLSRLERLLADLRKSCDSLIQRRRSFGLGRWALAVLSASPTELRLFDQLRADERRFKRRLAYARRLADEIEDALTGIP